VLHEIPRAYAIWRLQACTTSWLCPSAASSGTAPACYSSIRLCALASVQGSPGFSLISPLQHQSAADTLLEVSNRVPGLAPPSPTC